MKLRHLAPALVVLSLTACAAEDPVAQTVTASATTTETEVETKVMTTTKTPEPSGTITLPAETLVQTELQTVVQTTMLPAPGPEAAFDDGSYIVGKDIQPGTYQASATGDDCYWVRKDQVGEIIDNNFGSVMTVQSSDFLVETNRCGSWVLVG